MKVVIIYRQRRSTAHSIEELFRTVAAELRNHVEVIEYETGSRWQALLDAWRLRKLKADLYHVTGDINFLVLLLPRRRTILTVHDIGHLVHNLSGLQKWIYKWIWMMLPCHYAASVTVISEATRNEIEKHLGIHRTFIVVPNCYPAHFTRRLNRAHNAIPKILQVGTSPHKNLSRVIDAVKDMECCLVIIGPLNNAQLSRLAETGIKYESYVDLTPEKLVDQYALADIVCFASLHEGFGLPIIEAQVIGRPVITSNISPMCDVASDSACLVNPYDAESIREAINKLLVDEEYRSALVEKGCRNAERYTPSIVASKYIAVYQDIALHT